MPTRYRVNLTPESAGHLEEIFKYIEAGSPQNAPRVIQRLLDGIFSLEQLPHRFKVVRNTSAVGETIRSMPVPPFLVRYHVDDGARRVTILSVRHGARRSNVRRGRIRGHPQRYRGRLGLPRGVAEQV
jgi:plasmid stabilization system protein ParE